MQKRFRKALSLLLPLALLIATLPNAPAFAVGEGNDHQQLESIASREITQDAEGVYEIGSAEELVEFRNLVNSGQTSINARLTQDINLSETQGKWTPIGNDSNRYSGTFDGDGHTIEGLYIDTNDDYQGLFGVVGTGGTVQNLTVSGSVTVGDNVIGAGDDVAGVVGWNEGTVKACSNACDVTADGTSVGGVVGRNFGTVEACSNTGKVKAEGDSAYVGGVVGYNYDTVTACSNIGTVTATGEYAKVGGVVGRNFGTVEACSNTGEVKAEGDSAYVGGVVGDNYGGTVEACSNIGEITADGNGALGVGGVAGYNVRAGYNVGTVSDCYYLQNEGDAISGIGGNYSTATNVEPKTGSDYASGEVAWLLQNALKADAGQVWGQTLSGENIDAYPVLTSDSNKAVHQLPLKLNYEGAPDGGDYHFYYNNSTVVALPTSEEMIREDYVFEGWYTDEDCTGEPVTTIDTSEITESTTYWAKWRALSIDASVTGVTVNGTAATINDTDITVTLPAGSSLPDASTIQIEAATGATVSNLSSSDGGASWTFTVTAEDGTTIATYTLTVTIAEPEPEPEPTPEPEPEPTPEPEEPSEPSTPTPEPEEPSGPATEGSAGWSDIADELSDNTDGASVTVKMNGETDVPAEIFTTIAGENVSVAFDLEDGLSWTVNGADIPTDADLSDLNLGVTLGTDDIPVDVIDTITSAVDTVQITLDYDGAFGFSMTLTAPLGAENAGYWANLYHYDEDAEQLVFESAVQIDAAGNAALPMHHASQYAIVIDDHSHASAPEEPSTLVHEIFTDVAPDAWYTDAVQYAYDHGLMTGTSVTTFAPETTTTRAMIVSILHRLEGSPVVNFLMDYDDVAQDAWYSEAVRWATSEGIVSGYGDGTFQPNKAISREEMAAILYRYAKYKGIDVSARATLDAYSDAGDVSPWATDVMRWAVAEGLVRGMTDNTLDPQGTATRAQVAAMLERFIENVL